MNHFWIKTSFLIKKLFPNYVWHIPNDKKEIYLTFDDGPTPEITEWTLNVLKEYEAKATFFCIGDNIRKYPETFKEIVNNGHTIGNHTFNHLKGWKEDSENYLKNVVLCHEQILSASNGVFKSNLFRPPYGKIKASQSKKIRALGYKIIMWDVLSVDYDSTTTPEKCLENVISNVQSGSIIVFHDSLKACQNLKYALPKTLKVLKNKEFIFKSIVLNS